MFNLFQSHMEDTNLNTCSKSKQMLLDMLDVISASLNCSDSTVKLQDDGKYGPTMKKSSSERTVVVDSKGNAVSNSLFIFFYFIFFFILLRPRNFFVVNH